MCHNLASKSVKLDCSRKITEAGNMNTGRKLHVDASLGRTVKRYLFLKAATPPRPIDILYTQDHGPQPTLYLDSS
jgi:hypothetical protein